jgi:hypothetical protein
LEEEEQYEALVKYKTKMLGNIRLIAHLVRRNMLAVKVFLGCAGQLLKIESPETLETLCVLLSTVGDFLRGPKWEDHAVLQGIHRRVKFLSVDVEQSQRIRCLLKDVVEKQEQVMPEVADSSAATDRNSKNNQDSETRPLCFLGAPER